MQRKHYPLLTGILAALLTAVPLVILAAYFAYRDDFESMPVSDLSPPSESKPLVSASSVTADPSRNSRPQLVQDKAEFAAVTTEAVPTPSLSTIPPTSVQTEIVTSFPVEGMSDVVPLTAAVGIPTEPEVRPRANEQDDIRSVPEPIIPAAPVSELSTIPTRVAVDQSYYEATGHLALVSQPQVLDAAATMATEDEEPDPALIEEVHVKTPVEKTGVAQVENLIASTRAKGWPIALVRSDIPDDVWWVQQVVGIQGNTFAARLNFGNQNSLSGSTYTMVIVFLDSPDEVRRFRIAKQFKDIPKGIRRSREFNYVRN